MGDIPKNDTDINLTTGESLEINCTVYDFPIPDVQRVQWWFIVENDNKTTVIGLNDTVVLYNNTPGQMTYSFVKDSVTSQDAGQYVCNVSALDFASVTVISCELSVSGKKYANVC